MLEALKDFYANVSFFVKDGEVRAFAGGGLVPPRAPEEANTSGEKKEKGSQSGSGDGGSAEGGSAAGDDAMLGYFKGSHRASYYKYSPPPPHTLNVPSHNTHA